MSESESFGGELHLDGKVQLFNGDSREVLKALPDNSIDSVVTDPPYALVSIVKRFGGENAAPAKGNEAYMRASAGFMQRTWDTGETAFAVEFWAEVMRVLKPGGHVIAASGTRTYHRLACAIEDAGFEIRDMVVEYIESDYALNAFFESLNTEQKCAFVKMIDERLFGGIFGWLYGSGFPKSHDVAKGIDKAAGHWRGRAGDVVIASQVAKGTEYERTGKGDPITEDAIKWAGFGTALKPAIEPWVLARKPLGEKTVAANVLRWGTGALNIDATRVGTDIVGWGGKAGGTREVVCTPGNKDGEARPVEGRWPANVIHDGAFSEDWGRYFYSAKADSMDRMGSKHPTVKPVDLMQYLCRLITPPGGIVLDPFAGSGSTGEAAWREGFRCVLIEREADYAEDIRDRLRLANRGTDARKRAVAVKKSKGEELGGLFAV